MLPALLPNQVGLFKSSGFYEVWYMVILSFNINQVPFCPSFDLKLHGFILFAFKGQRLYRCFCFIILCKVLFSQLCCTFFLFPKCYWFEILPTFKILFVSAFLPNLLDSNTNDCPSCLQHLWFPNLHEGVEIFLASLSSSFMLRFFKTSWQ